MWRRQGRDDQGPGSNAEAFEIKALKVEAKGFDPERQPAARPGDGKARGRMRKREAGPRSERDGGDTGTNGSPGNAAGPIQGGGRKAEAAEEKSQRAKRRRSRGLEALTGLGSNARTGRAESPEPGGPAKPGAWMERKPGPHRLGAQTWKRETERGDAEGQKRESARGSDAPDA